MAKKEKKPRPDKYEDKVKIEGGLFDVLKLAVKDADAKTKAKNKGE